MDKLIRDGKVAVLYSPGFGAGWSTWGLPTEAIFHPELVEATLAEDRDRMAAIAKREWPDEYHGGLRGLTVGWVREGVQFRITEYDGNESVVFRDSESWLTA